MMVTNDPRAEFRQRREKRKALFVSLGVRPFQILLSAGVWFNLLTVVVTAVYLYSSGHKQSLRVSLFLEPVVYLLLWFFHGYLRVSFILLALFGAWDIIGFVMRPRADYLSLSFLLSYVLITIAAGVLWGKMKDPIFSIKIS
jgi:hypothetical protein